MTRRPQSRTHDRRASLVWLLLAGLPLAGLPLGCGSGGMASSTTGGEATKASSTSGGAVVARVGTTAITQHDLVHRMAVLATEEGLTPIDETAYARCLAALEAARSPEPYGSDEVASRLAQTRCGWANAELLRKALVYLISSNWLIEGARSVGRGLSERRAEAKLDERQGSQVPNASGRTRADALFDVQARSASKELQEYGETVPSVTAAEVEARFKHESTRFKQESRRDAVPELRDINILRLDSEAEALKARREIQSGKSFAAIARGKPRQPDGSHEGHIQGLYRRAYAEPKLIDAIFTARPHTLSQPVGIRLGFYVFEVTRTHPPHHRTPAEASQQIERELTLRRRQAGLQRFAAAWRSKWKSKTYCHTGVLIADCSESRLAPTRASEGPFALE